MCRIEGLISLSFFTNHKSVTGYGDKLVSIHSFQ